ncbi:MAG: hypothetical protein AB7O73_08995 [Bacteroidia bacterium]
MTILEKKFCLRRAVKQINWRNIHSHNKKYTRRNSAQQLIEMGDAMILTGVSELEILPWLLRFISSDSGFTVTIHYIGNTSSVHRKQNRYDDGLIDGSDLVVLERILNRYVAEEKYELAAIINKRIQSVKRSLGA